MNPDLTVIIPTYNGRNKLPGIMDALEYQTISGFDVLVVVDGSTDGSQDYLSSYKSSNYSFKIVEQENGGRSRVRNRGAKLASSDLLIFFDDDMRPESDCIEKHLEFHENHKRAICGGNQLENLWQAKNDFDRYRCFLRRKWLAHYHGMTKLSENNLYLTAANFSIPKSLFIELDGFNEQMRDHEDRDLGMRALEAGIEVFFDTDNIAWHDDFVTPVAYIQRRRQYHREFEKLGSVPAQDVLKKMWHAFFAKKYWVVAIEKESLMMWPKFIRYRIYNYVIWGFGSYFPNRSLSE